MSNDITFDDTFDNFTLPSNCKIAEDDENLKEGPKFPKENQREDEIGIISFDDSAFLNESFSFIKNGSKEIKSNRSVSSKSDQANILTENNEVMNLLNGVDRKCEETVSNRCDFDKNCDKKDDFSYDIDNCSSFNISENFSMNKQNSVNKFENHIEVSKSDFNLINNIEDADLFDDSDDILQGSKELQKNDNNQLGQGNLKMVDGFDSILFSNFTVNDSVLNGLENIQKNKEQNPVEIVKGDLKIEKLESEDSVVFSDNSFVDKAIETLNSTANKPNLDKENKFKNPRSCEISENENQQKITKITSEQNPVEILKGGLKIEKLEREDSVVFSDNSFIDKAIEALNSTGNKSNLNKENIIKNPKSYEISENEKEQRITEITTEQNPVEIFEGDLKIEKENADSVVFSDNSFTDKSIETLDTTRNKPNIDKENKFKHPESNEIFENKNEQKITEITIETKPIKLQISQLSCELSDWNLPEMILQKYAKNNISKMFEWQKECLNNEEILQNNKNLVYSAPTSAGKTLVAEILGIKTLIERHKKVIFVLPFVSVVREKMFHFQDLLSTSGIRVDGFMGSYHPPGGFKTVQLAICTIEKANGLINKLLDENELEDVGSVIVDEIHLLGDSSRGYLLELLLTKLKYMSRKNKDVNIQIIGMSATLPNLELLAKWLDAELFTTEFRPIPLFEQYHVHGEIYDNNLKLIRKLPVLKELETDTDNILQLCLETIQSSCSVLIFCPTKNWCESLSQQIASAFWKLGNAKNDLGQCLRSELNPELIAELLEQLKRCPVGLDKVLSKTISFGVAFHHAGLTMDERDIIEGGFRTGALRVLVATSTLSSGVNLPARRVIIRTPNFHGKPIDTLTYRQMIGRAGRMGKDTAGESLLICQKNDYKLAKELMSTKLDPVESCLQSGKLKRAILEVIASGVASSLEDVNLFANCTLLSTQEDELQNPIEEAISFLQRNEFIRLQTSEDGILRYVATSLGKACLSSSLPPEEGLTLFTELEKARRCFVLETELHLIYLVTPYNCCNQWGNIDWMFYLSLWEKLSASMKRVGELVGIREAFMISASRGKPQSNQKLQIHKRFYTALALQDLVNEVPLNTVASKFNCSRGLLQSLQQSASTFAGMVTSFSKQLGWTSVELLISQFQDRLHFGINRDLLDLMRLPVMNGPRARTLYNAGIQTLAALASSGVDTIENILHKVVPFESEKEREGESKFDAERRNKIRTVWVTGKQGLTEREAAEILINDARRYIELEMGLVDAKWGSGDVKKDEGKDEKLGEREDNSDGDVKELKVTRRNILYKSERVEGLDKNGEVKIGVKRQTEEERDEDSTNIKYLKIDNSTPKPKSDTNSSNNTFNFSDTSLFENSFNLNTINVEEQKIEEVIKTPEKTNKKIESPEEVDNLDLKLSLNTSDIVTNVSNTSSEFIASSQNHSSNVNTPLKLICNEMTRKRKLSKRSSNAASSTDLKETPSKKIKLVKSRSSKTIKNTGSGKIDPAFVITQEKPFATFTVNNAELKTTDFSKLDIINVSDHEDVFKSFRTEIRTQKEISLSVGCAEVRLTQAKIGVKSRTEMSECAKSNTKIFSCGNKEVKGVSVCWGGNTVYYISFESTTIPNEDKVNILKEVLANPEIKVKIFDGKEVIKIVDLCLDVDFNTAIEDPKIADWLLDPDSREKNLHAMSVKYAPETVNLLQLVGVTKGVGSIGLDVTSTSTPKLRSAVESVVTWHLVQAVLDVVSQLDMKLLHAYYIEMSVIRILAKMELTGLGVNLPKLEELSNTLVQQNLALERKAFQLAGRTFSFTSSNDVAKILGLYQAKKRVSTNKQVLEKNVDNPIAPLIVQWRKINSVLTKTIYPLLRSVRNSRIYGSCILQNATGRISMHEPNLQCVPRNFEAIGDENQMVMINCREAFQAKDKYLLVSADYCQLELRLLAHFSKDESLLDAMRDVNKDVFKSVAAKLNSVEVNEVTDDMRQNAKQICYGIIYGMGVKSLAEQMKCSDEEATVFLEMFHEKYPRVRRFIQEVIEKCRDEGFVETLAGRRRYLLNIANSHQGVKSQAERQAVNTTIQGSAADIAKNAMVLIDNTFREKFKNSRNKPDLVLQLHDEFLYEVPEKYLSTAVRIVQKCMENSVQLSVPFPVKIRVGKSWGQLEEKKF